MAATIEIRVEDCGVKKNKGQGWNAWIRSTDNRVYYSKFCQDEEEGKAAIRNLKSGDKIFLKFTVKNGFNNLVSYQSNSLETSTDKKTEKQEDEKKPVEQKKENPAKTGEQDKHREKDTQKMKAMEKELNKEEQAKEKAFYDLCVEHYTSAINTAKEIVKNAEIEETDPLFVPAVTVILDKIATPKVYLKKEIL